MARTAEDFTYSYEEMARLSGWDVNRIYQDATRKSIQMGRLEQVVVWLAANGVPELRAEMARSIVPVVLGTKRERQTSRDKDLDKRLDTMLALFEHDAGARKGRAKKISRTKLKLSS
jgi:hypothetical protein